VLGIVAQVVDGAGVEAYGRSFSSACGSTRS
jgi:hypothetical protein